MVNDPELKAVFIAESKEQVARLKRGMACVVASPRDVDTLQSMCDDIHSLKGSAQMVDAQNIARFARGLEYMLKSVLEKEIALGNATMGQIEGQMDFLSQLIEAAESGECIEESDNESLWGKSISNASDLEEIEAERLEPLKGIDQSDLPMILLVDDTETVRIRAQRILENGGYGVVTAGDGVDALAKLEAYDFVGVMTDIEMPNMNGLVLTQKIRTHPRLSKLPIILMSSLASKTDLQNGLDAGANAYLTKTPDDRRRILTVLSELLRENRE